MRIFTTPFAINGDRGEISESFNSNGVVSYQNGFGSDYEKDLREDPDAKNIERKKLNQLLYDITDTILGIQKLGSQPWNAALKPYPKGATIFHDTDTYLNLVGNNQNTPSAQDAGGGGTGWIALSLLDKLNHLDELSKKNTAVLEPSGFWECGDTGFAIQWGTLTAFATGRTRVGGSANFRWPFSAIFHVGATTSTSAANTRDGYNTHISIDGYTDSSISLAFETNATKGINIQQSAFWFVLGILRK